MSADDTSVSVATPSAFEWETASPVIQGQDGCVLESMNYGRSFELVGQALYAN